MNQLQTQYRQEIEDLADVSRTLARLGFVASHGGNLSYKLESGMILITPTKVPKAEVSFDDIVIVDETGAIVFVPPGRRPTGETPMHTHLYRLRPDLKSLIHAHPPVLTGFALYGGNILSRPLLPEPIIELGPILTVPYAEPISEMLAISFNEAAQYSNAFLMSNHGVTIGSTEGIKRTLGLLEMAEAMAISVSTAARMGNVREIPREEVKNLERTLRTRNLPFPGSPGVVKSLESLYFGDIGK